MAPKGGAKKAKKVRPASGYKGLIPTTARQVPLNMVRFISVEWCKKALAGFD